MPRTYIPPSTFQTRQELKQLKNSSQRALSQQQYDHQLSCILSPHNLTKTDQGKKWKSLKAESSYKDSKGRVILIHKLAGHADFCVPPELPQGNVGTPTRILEAAINRCALRVSTLRLLGGSINYNFRRSTRRKYAEVPYAYPPPPQVHTHKKETILKLLQTVRHDRRTKSLQRNDTLLTTAFPIQNKVVKNDPLSEGTIQGSPVMSLPEEYDDQVARGGCHTGGDSEGDEWDRHDALHGVDETYAFKYRTHTQSRDAIVFEDVEANDHSLGGNIWDKGDASGLVIYTDDVFWESNAIKGDFDERNTDDWDVEFNKIGDTNVSNLKSDHIAAAIMLADWSF